MPRGGRGTGGARQGKPSCPPPPPSIHFDRVSWPVPQAGGEGRAGSLCSLARQCGRSSGIDPWQAAQLAHQSPRVDREDSGMTCFPCFLSQKGGWRQGAGGLILLLPAGTWGGAPAHFPGAEHPLLSPVALPGRRAGCSGPGGVGPALDHRLSPPQATPEAIWVPSTQVPRGLCFPHPDAGNPEEDRLQNREIKMVGGP